MKSRFYRPLSLACISPTYFPDIALFVRNSGNYILYKNHDRKFTEADQHRLARTNTQFLYVRSGDMDVVTEYLEQNLDTLLARDDIDSGAKGTILYQTAANYVTDVFDEPGKTADIIRCRNLIRHLMKYVAGHEDALKALQAITSQNYYIFTHSVQVAALMMLVHDRLFNLNQDEMTDVGVGSLLHDVGLVFLSGNLLDTPEALTAIEYHKVKQHAQKGYEHLSAAGTLGEVSLTIVRHHHEKYDGSGYPAGLKGDDIPRSAQLAALCDTYCAMTTNRPKHTALPGKEALRIMEDEVGSSFSPEMFERFAAVVERKGKARKLSLIPSHTAAP
ncbi:HD domain-containing protein [Geobacter hydrogenophilus]|uniref:HD family phosphohydrolase n=1 Tax=Geobacter hydrogenophilus TaxID=40983 RepID=A0A9W6G470_9BACT|nr:HD domain-containing phosphohydrolase [Geobacter hydrogenophilus]MBT0892639.1 HD domain-containing protein [Geobacter hydrogenophilus]GLI40037.1 HD family phosphohydrolase [Geobacter hydrogenophilus]